MLIDKPVTGLLTEALKALRESEARFRDLAQLSCDWYWEQDAELRFISHNGGTPLQSLVQRPDDDLGKTRWELPLFGVSRDDWQAHKDALAARLPFRNFTYQRRDAAGHAHHISVSGYPVVDEHGTFRGYRGIARDITNQKREAQLLVLEHAVARCLADADDVVEALKAVLRALCETEGWEYGRYWRADDRAGVLRFCTSWHASGSAIAPHLATSEGTVFSRGTGLVGRVWQSGQPLWVADLTKHAGVLKTTLAPGMELHGACMFPVATQGSTIGVMSFVSREVREPDERLLDAFLVIGSQVGQFVQRKQREVALRDSEARFRSLTELSSDWYWEQDEDLRFTSHAGSAPDGTALRFVEDRGRTLWELPVFGVSAEDSRAHRETLAAHQPFRDFTFQRRDDEGAVRHVSISGHPVFDERGVFRGYRGIGKDITASKQAQQAIEHHALQQGLIAAFGHRALANVDLDGLSEQAAQIAAAGLSVDFCNVLLLALDGRSLLLKASSSAQAEWIGRRTADRQVRTPSSHVLATGTPVTVEDFGEETWFSPSEIVKAYGIRSCAEVPIIGSAGAYGVLGAYSREARHVSRDAVNYLQSLANTLATAMDRKQAEQRLTYLAQFDPLTGLANRALFLDRFAQTLVQAQRNTWLVAVLFIDLDRFKVVNDTLGHEAGDKLLVQVAQRLKECVRATDTVARLGGDEFASVLCNLTKPDDAALVAQKVVGTLSQTFALEGQDVCVSASVGIAIYPGDGSDADTLLRNADTAMYRAKEQGRDAYRFYLPSMNEQSLQRLQLQSQLRGALERREFVLHYQPKASLESGEISGFEALLRWQHPTRGLVPPLQFISILEETGLIVPVGEWVVRTVCEQLASWRAQGAAPRPVAINLSARQFQQKNLDASIAAILTDTGVDPGLLEFELTESMLMSDPVEAARMLNNMRAYGVRLAVDDFGTGYSSLTYLKRFPLDALKIDRAFIRDVTTDPDDASITVAIIRLAHSLKLKVVAEGVETRAQLEFLQSHGCDEMQGYYFAKPLPADDCTAALIEKRCLG